jgi:excisionase family DNA binding protein
MPIELVDGEVEKVEGSPTGLLKIAEVIDYARVSDSTIRRAVREGGLRAYALPGGLRFRPEAVDDWIESFAVTPQPQPRRSTRKLSGILAAEHA